MRTTIAVAYSDVIGTMGLVATVLGFTAALIQLARTRAAAVAARDAVATTEDQLAKNELLSLLPRLIDVDNGLDLSSVSDDRQNAATQLGNWRESAMGAHGLLEDRDLAPAELLVRLKESAILATRTKREILMRQDPVRDIVKAAHAEISHICNDLSSLQAKVKAQARVSAGETTK